MTQKLHNEQVKLTKIVCVGDSITEGYGIEHPQNNYPSLLQSLLGSGFQVYNEGHSGACVTNALLNGYPLGVPYIREPEYQQALKDRGDLYVVMLGTNDAQDGMHDTEDIQNPYDDLISKEADFEGYFEEIIDGIRAAVPDAEIFFCKPAPVLNCIWRSHQEKYLLRLLPHYDSLAAKHPDWHLIDVHEAFVSLQTAELENCYQPDQLHPNENGAEIIAMTVAKALKTFLASE